MIFILPTWIFLELWQNFDPFISDPFIAKNDWTPQMKNPSVKVVFSSKIEPKEGITLLGLNRNSSLRKYGVTTWFNIAQINHKSLYARPLKFLFEDSSRLKILFSIKLFLWDKCLLFQFYKTLIFAWWSLQLRQKKLFGTWQFGKIGVWKIAG